MPVMACLDFDRQIVDAEVDSLEKTPSTVLDLGCGTGRSLVHAHAKGHRVVGVDLSSPMLECAREKLQQQCTSEEDRNRIRLVHANIVDRDLIERHSVDLALCLYSSFGMIKEQKNRLQCLQQVHNYLCPTGKLILHVHNRRNWWLTAMGRSLVWKDYKNRFFNRKTHELGDRFYAYRNLPAMFLHIFTSQELKRLLHSSGFVVEKWIYLNQSSAGLLDKPWFLPGFRSAGFIVIVRKGRLT